MQRLRVEYARGEQVRFLSHLDMIRLFERAIRRAEIPILYSEGFNPHPKLAFGPPLAVGMSSEREYFDISLGRITDPEDFRQLLNRHLPEGIRLKQVVEIPEGTSALMAVISQADYEVELQGWGEITQGQLDESLKSLLAQKNIQIQRQGKKGAENKDIREGIFRLAGKVTPARILLQMELRNDNQGNVRPDEVVNALLDYMGATGSNDDTISRTVLRTGLFARRAAETVSPLEVF